MKALCVLVVSAVLGSLCAFGADVSPGVVKGETFEQVVQKLGVPKGKAQGGHRTTYYYDRGTVDFLTGRVERVFLITAQAAKEKIAEREKAEENSRRQAEAERVRIMTAGKAQREKMLGDKTFMTSSPVAQIAYWDDFKKQYPGVDVGAPLADAKKALASANEKDEKTEDFISLNRRAAEIEGRFKQLDQDYAASLANWKRTEIDQERARLTEELAGIKARVAEMLK
ncbi:MAG: hypothetical protein WCI03_09080 [bacterium]|jgi:hypothetical protein